ncbi:nibrin isoform X2 [Megalops cyprinoides]|uniref:nibrin isoform X2 n=1 Tax=Megalops cyprinoides TaxID=118141 RepID=UPI001864DD6B|nr:nibrin isoform X2 [Megalops cyprinoides]
MWKLNPVEAGGKIYYLLPGETYVVGRKNCEVLLQNDQSISRIHAHLTVSSPNGSQNEPATLTLKDSSKYGTFVNGERLANEAPKVLRSGDRVTFGVFLSKFHVVYEPLVVCSSCVDNEGKAALLRGVQQLGGQLVNSWTQHCTHLVMPSVKVTIKTICALICCRPIVKPEFFSELRRALQQKQPPPKPESFYPEIDEPSLNKEDVDLNARPARKSLFRGKTFIFLSAKQQKRLSSAVAFGGGQSQLLEEGSLPVSVLESTGSCVVDVATSNSQALLPAATKKWSDSVAQVLKRKGLRFIAESEIGLAAIYVTTDKYCNPLSQIDSERVTMNPTIPSATMSQSTAVDETVLPAASQNVTAYAPDTEPSQGINSSRMNTSTSGVRAVAETPEKEQRRAGSSSRAAAAKDPAVTCTVAESMMSSYSAIGAASLETKRERATLAPRSNNDNFPAPKPALNNGNKNKSPQKQSNSLTNYFQPVSKKRTREGSDPADQLEAKHSRREGEGPEESTSAPQHNNPWKRTPQATSASEPFLAAPALKGDGPGPSLSLSAGPSREAERDSEAGWTPSSKKRKGMEAPDPVEDLEMDDLESIMSLPMEEPGEPATSSKKQRLEPVAKVKQEEVSFTEASKPEQGLISLKQNKSEHKTLSVKGETKDSRGEDGEDLPRNLLMVEFKSLVVSSAPRPRTSALQALDANRKNFKKFRKVPVPGTNGLPNIIGGSDLVAHNRAKNSELEEWLREAAEEEQQNSKEEMLGDDLFRYNPKPSRRR